MPDPTERLPDFPETADGRFGYAVARGTLGVVPYVGGGLQSILDQAIGEPLKLRQEEWFKTVAKGLQDLQDRLEGFDARSLGENVSFVGLVYEATDQAMRAQNKERLNILRNVVLNTAAGFAIDDVLRGRFMGYVGRFSIAHIRVLKAMDSPRSFPEMVAVGGNMSMGSFWPVLQAGVPELSQREDLLEVIVAELEVVLFVFGFFFVLLFVGSNLNQHTTALGRAFLKFISTPDSLKT